MERHFGSYLPGLVEAVGESESKVSKRVVQFEEDFKEYIAKKGYTQSKTSASENKQFKVLLKATGSGNSFIGVLIDKTADNKSVAKFIVKQNYISLKGYKGDTRKLLELIESKIQNQFNPDFEMPSRVMTY